MPLVCSFILDHARNNPVTSKLPALTGENNYYDPIKAAFRTQLRGTLR